MPAVIAMFFLGLVALLQASYLPEQAAQMDAVRADADATSLLAYREAVVDYLNAHPGFTGTVPDAALAFPWGYRRDPRWTHVAGAGGALFVHEAAASPHAVAVVEQLERKTLQSFTPGLNARGQLVGVLGAATGIVVPASVPDGAVLVFGR